MSEAILHFGVIHSLLSSTCQWELYTVVCLIKITWLCLALQFRSYGYSDNHRIIKKRKILICPKLNHSGWERNSVFTSSQLWAANSGLLTSCAEWSCELTSVATTSHAIPHVRELLDCGPQPTKSSKYLLLWTLHCSTSSLPICLIRSQCKLSQNKSHLSSARHHAIIKEPTDSRMADLQSSPSSFLLMVWTMDSGSGPLLASIWLNNPFL